MLLTICSTIIKNSSTVQSVRTDIIFILPGTPLQVELLFLFSAHRLMVVYICTKFHENILGGIEFKERTRFSL